MKHELDKMMDLIKDYKTGYGGVTDSFMRKELEMFAKDYHSEQCNIDDVRQRIIAYTNWLSKQNLMICEGVDGHTFRSSMIGGKKYTAEELYDKFISEYVA